MQYAKGYPCEYGLSGQLAIKTPHGYQDVMKNGSSWYISNRKSGAVTYFPSKPIFDYVIVLDREYFSTKNDLYILDAQFVDFMKQKGLGEYYVSEGGGTEWFYRSCPVPYLELRVEFLKQKGIPIVDILTHDPFPIHDLSPPERAELDDEDTICTKRRIQSERSLKDRFFQTFLPHKQPRRIQSELWDVMETICQSEGALDVKGIVQWPVGTGKTIAMMISIVSMAERCKRLGQVYHGLLVSPKNDIFKTIKKEINKLSQFGISVYDGSEGKLSSLSIPINQHSLTFACHQALLNEKGLNTLPDIGHISYDEVHRITGEEFFTLLKRKMTEWRTELLTGTSATPKTCSKKQHDKLAELFGDPLRILHHCDIQEAVEEGWIAKPRFVIRILPKLKNRATILESFVDSVVDVVRQKGKGGKSIFYIETSTQEVYHAYSYAKKTHPGINFYAAIDGERTDEAFLRSAISKTDHHILFSCQRYREGSDIDGLELTGRLVGNTTAAHTLIQILGRALRMKDDPTKEGWCVIVRPCEEGTTEEDVMDSIILDIADFMGNTDKSPTRKNIEELVNTYFGEVSISGNRCSLQETIERVQAAYLRNQYAKRTPKEQYGLIRAHNIEMGIQSRIDYEERAAEHPKYIEHPEEYFKDYWVSWYHFLGVDTSLFPPTKQEWVRRCRELELLRWDDYREKRPVDMPSNPREMYDRDFTNWDNEIGVEDDYVW